MATNAELASKIKELEAKIDEMKVAFDSYDSRDTRVDELYDPYTCPKCGDLMMYVPMRNNFWCAKCHEELDLYAGKKTGVKGLKK